jgi:hypothetical protein
MQLLRPHSRRERDSSLIKAYESRNLRWGDTQLSRPSPSKRAGKAPQRFTVAAGLRAVMVFPLISPVGPGQNRGPQVAR